MIELIAFENAAVALKERETEVLWGKAELAHYAVEHDDNLYYRAVALSEEDPRAARLLAHLWGCSAQTVKTLAQIFETFSEDEIAPDIPLSLWNAVMETDDPTYALRLATDYEFRRKVLGEEFAKTDKEGTWSSSDLRRFYDIQKGRHYASAIKATVKVTTWDTTTGGFGVIGFPVSGEMPEWALVAVRERLEKEEG